MYYLYKQPQETLGESGCELDENKATPTVHLGLQGKTGILCAHLSVLSVGPLTLITG